MTKTTMTRKQEEVYQACNNLHSRAERITNETIGQELVQLGYRRGSNSDITRYKRLWQEQFAIMNKAKIVLPQRTDKLEAALDEMRVEIQREADIELEHYKQNMVAEKKQWEETLQYAQQEITDLRLKIIDLEQHLQRSQDILKKSLEEQETLTQQFTTEKQRYLDLQDTEKHNNDIFHAEKVAMENELTALRDIQIQFQNMAKSERSDLMEKMEAQRHQHIVDLEQLKGNIYHLEKALTKADTQQQQLKVQNQQLLARENSINELVRQLQKVQQVETLQIIKAVTNKLEQESTIHRALPDLYQRGHLATIEKLHAISETQKLQGSTLTELTHKIVELENKS